jgi:uncharacterized protein (UPF0333 family)
MTTATNQDATVSAVSQSAALIITASEGMERTASTLAGQLKLTIEIASSRATALRLLGRRSYAIVILDQNLAVSDPDGADLIWKNAGVAIPLQINFALTGRARLEREVRAALVRRQREQQLASTAAVTAVDAELKNAITGFLLESRLALAEENIPPQIETRLKALAEMADRLRERLVPPAPGCTTTVPLSTPQR